MLCFFFSSRRRHTRYWRDWSSDVCSFRSLARWDPFSEVASLRQVMDRLFDERFIRSGGPGLVGAGVPLDLIEQERSEERRVGKECRSRWSPCHLKKKEHTDSHAY